jgi:hypothetical protein
MERRRAELDSKDFLRKFICSETLVFFARGLNPIEQVSANSMLRKAAERIVPNSGVQYEP